MDYHNNIAKYNDLRKRFSQFTYESFSITHQPEGLLLSYVFKVGQYSFHPHMTIMKENFDGELSSPALQSMAFHIGMVEMISYWKAFCCPQITVIPYQLNKEQQKWWKKLFIHGLGEFFYTNGIALNGKDPFSFSFSDDANPIPPPYIEENPNEKLIIPIGGGKDSVVTVELLKTEKNTNHSLVINPRPATRRVIEAARFDSTRNIEVFRYIDPLLFRLNEEGFLNGHTPFSALLAFVSLLAAHVYQCSHIALSNESSANEPSIPGTSVNHQYSKSIEFENDFRNYAVKYLHNNINYFSFLRPLNELQIAALFSQMPQYHDSFRSCNAGSKSDIWCCECSKCLFTYIILSPFLSEDDLVNIFGDNLFNKPALLPILDQLCGLTNNKPFECVGTIEEVNTALVTVLEVSRTRNKQLPALLHHYKQVFDQKAIPHGNLQQLLHEIREEGFVSPKNLNTLKEKIKDFKLPR